MGTGNERQPTLTHYLNAKVRKVVTESIGGLSTLMPNTRPLTPNLTFIATNKPLIATNLNFYIVDLLPIDVYPIR